MERKLLCVCMTLVMFCVGINVKAEIANGTCGENLTWVLSDDGTLNISGSGAMATWYSPSSTPWYSYISEIKKVVIGSSVTVIGNIAFYECSTLDSVRISNSVTSIGEYAFHGCKGLKSVEIPNSVTDIGGGAFSDCTGLASVTIPNSVTSIGESAFSGCTGLTSVTIPNSITHIAGDAFRGCSKISEVNISCKDEDDLANYVQRTDIFDVFYASLHATSKTHNIIINNKKQDSIIIPNSVTNMGNYAFAECKSLKSVHISNSTTRIGEYAFMNCTNLASVTIPNSVKEIRDCAFYQCSSLTSVTIPNSITYEAFGAFDGCSKISEVNVACKDEDDFVTYVQRTDISRIFHSPLHTVSRTKNIIINGENEILLLSLITSKV